MEVTIVKRSKQGAVISTPLVEIGDNCVECGAKRGEPFGFNFWEDGTSHWCQQWKNPCGHVDYYKNILVEANTIQEVGND